MDVTPSGTVNDFNDEQFSNILSSIEVTAGRLTDSSEVQPVNMPMPSVVTVAGMVMVLRDVQLLNAV